jgi:hypothetical protein
MLPICWASITNCLFLTAHGVAKSRGEGEGPLEESSEGSFSWHAG